MLSDVGTYIVSEKFLVFYQVSEYPSGHILTAQPPN